LSGPGIGETRVEVFIKMAC